MERYKYTGETAEALDAAEIEGIDACLGIVQGWINRECNVYLTTDLQQIEDEILDRKNMIRPEGSNE